MNAHFQGKPRSRLETTATVMVSTRQGDAAKRNTTNESFFKASGSNPNPARIKMTTSAMLLLK